MGRCCETVQNAHMLRVCSACSPFRAPGSGISQSATCALNSNLIFEIGSKESGPKELCFLCLNKSDVERLTFFKNGIIFHNLFHIIFRFFERGNSLIAFNNFGACVVGRKRQRQLSIKAIYEMF